MAPVKRPATWLFLGVILISLLCLHLDFTPTAVDDHPADTAFSVKNAYLHLGHLAAVPHSLGTPANDTVGVYIDSVCRSMGLAVSRLPFVSINPVSKGLVVGRGVNILATLKGSGNGKKILVMGHYDSEPNALAAGDDGSACAAMLETARALRAGPLLDDDVLFLFTNGEEDGLLGAKAFARDSANLQDIGLVLNFDGRGDAGNCIMFRTSPHSHWLVEGYAHAPIHHGTGSFYNELFNLLPNNTDFTPLLKAHMPGLDFAFVEGFTAYHNLTDNLANLDPRTLQEEGDNMLGSVRYFGRTDLETDAGQGRHDAAGTGNDTFFDIVGAVMVHYSPTLNFMLVLLTNLLVVFALGQGLYFRRIKMAQLLIGLPVFIGTLAVLYFAGRWTLSGLRIMYPIYEGYYPNAYNGYPLYLALAAEAFLLFTLLYLWPLRRWSMHSLFMAVLLLQLFLLDFLYRFIPAGVYWLYWPLIGAAAVFPFLPNGKRKPKRILLVVLALLPAILLLMPMLYSLAVTFDIQGEGAVVAVIMGLLLGLSLPLLSACFRESRRPIPLLGLAVFTVAAITGIARGGYSVQKPLKTDLHYFVDKDKHAALWVSNDKQPDHWNKTFFSQITPVPNPYTYPLEKFAGNGLTITNTAPFIDLPAPVLVINKGYEDTAAVANGGQRLYLHCEPPPGTASIHLTFDPANPPTAIAIDGKTFKGPLGWMDYINPGPDGFDLLITCPTGKDFNVHLIARSMGLPAAAGFNGYPADVIPFPGPYANTTMIMDTYKF